MTDIPNLSITTSGIWCSGNPTELEQWQYLWDIGVRKSVKFDLNSEDTDALASRVGIRIKYHPISTFQQILVGPNDTDFRQGVSEIEPGTIIHCKNGWDRSRLAEACYRLWKLNWNKEEAEKEMLAHGFHKTLLGLWIYWLRQ